MPTTDVPARVRDHIAHLPVPPGDLAGVLAAARHRPIARTRLGRARFGRAGSGRAGAARAWFGRGSSGSGLARRGWAVPVLAAVAALAVVLAAGVVPGLLTGRGGLDGRPGEGHGGRHAASLPRRVAGYSYLTGSVSGSPPGRAIMLYQQGAGVELGDAPQALVLGADRDTLRRVDLAERRSARDDQGDPAPMLLSPDGTRVAVGSHGRTGDLAVVDLRTGRVRRYPAAERRNVDPLAWSPDGRSVLALEETGAVGSGIGQLPAPMVRFDLDSGRLTRYPQLTAVSAAAYAPDGRELAVQQGSSLRIVDPVTGDRLRELSNGLPLRTACAWSPDGRLIAVGPVPPGPPTGDTGTTALRTRIEFLDASGAGAPGPAGLTAASGPILGWAGPRTVLVRHAGTGHDNDNEILRIDLDHPDSADHRDSAAHRDGGRRLTAIDPGPADNFMVMDVQLATGLLDGLRSREPGPTDRGPWPRWWLVTVLVLFGAPAVLITWRALRRRPRHTTDTANLAGDTPNLAGGAPRLPAGLLVATSLFPAGYGAVFDIPDGALGGWIALLRPPLALLAVTPLIALLRAAWRWSRPLPVPYRWVVGALACLPALLPAAAGLGQVLLSAGLPLPFTLAGLASGAGYAATLRLLASRIGRRRIDDGTHPARDSGLPSAP